MQSISLKLVIASFIIGAGLITALFFVIDFEEFWQTAASITNWKIVLFLAIAGLVPITNTVRWRYIYRNIHKQLPFWESLGIRLAGFAGSFLTPVAEFGGTPIRLILNKQRLQVPWDKNIAGAVVDMASELLVYTLITGLGIIILLFYLNVFWAAWLLCGVILVLIFWITRLYFNMHSGDRFLNKMVSFLKLDQLRISKQASEYIKAGEEQAAQFIIKRKKQFFVVLALSVLANVLTFVDMAVLAYILSINLEVFEVYLSRVLMNLFYVVPVPAALGVAEWGEAGLFSAIGVGAATGAFFSLMFKAKEVFYAILGVVFLVFSGLQNFYWWVMKNNDYNL